MKKLLIINLIIFNCYSQTGAIQGNTYNRIYKHSAAFYGVRLTQQKKNKIYFLNYTQADSLGDFSFKKVKPGSYSLIISSIDGQETINNIQVVDNVTTYLNIIVPSYCIYDKDYESETLIPRSCPICKELNNVVEIQYYIPHLGTYIKGKEPKGYRKRKANDERFDSLANTYKITKFIIPYCKPRWYCKKDKVKF